ncbi:MAG TPA: hypothetical protein VNV44_01130 [Solirubrobacteraceae bacterium]|nr:hypothetical protein [Solirubrobacteraceae bacterium]
MFEQRKKRSDVREEALQYLIESVLDRSEEGELRCAAIIDGRSRVVAGVGMPWDLAELAKLAPTIARGGLAGLEASLDADDDVIAREVEVNGETLVLAAFGSRVRRMPAAVSAISRICAAA